MRKHAHLPAMVRFVGKHVAQHLHASRPRLAQPSLRNISMRPPPSSASASISAHPAALSANPARTSSRVACVRFSCRGTFRCGAVSRIHFVRTLCMCVKIAAIVRTLPGGLRSPCRRVQMLQKYLVHALIRPQTSGLLARPVAFEPFANVWSQLPAFRTAPTRKTTQPRLFSPPVV